MYGYNSIAEYERLREAALQGAELMEKEITGRAEGENRTEPPFSAWEILRLVTQIHTLRQQVTHDGNFWEQRPVDMLARSHMDTEGTPSAFARRVFAETRYQLALDRCRDWEATCLLFRFEKTFRDAALNAAGEKEKENPVESLSEEQVIQCARKPWRTLMSDVQELRSRQKGNRISYDVFDSAISYAERIARWQEDTAWGLPGAGADNSGTAGSTVCIPDTLYTGLLKKTQNGATNNKKSADLFSRFAQFCAMLYRHLQGIGVTAEDLDVRQDQDTLMRNYWALPGKSAFGCYQTKVQPDYFFDQIVSFTQSFSGSPVQLLKINDRWCAWMSRDLFAAFECDEKAEKAYQESRESDTDLHFIRPEGPAWPEIPEEERTPFWRSAYAAALTDRQPRPPVTERTVEAGSTKEPRRYLALKDDGSALPCSAIEKHIGSLVRSGDEKPAAVEADWMLLFKKAGNPAASLWRKAEPETRREWLLQAIGIFKQQPEITKQEGIRVSPFRLQLIHDNLYQKSVQKFAACLMVAFFCHVCGKKQYGSPERETESVTAFIHAGEEALNRFRDTVAAGQCYLTAYQDQGSVHAMMICIGDKERRMLQQICDPEAEPCPARPEEYNSLFESALALAEPDHALAGKCSTEYLPGWKPGNETANLKAFAQRALFWAAIRNGQAPQHFYELKNLWQDEGDVADFLRTNLQLSLGWIKQRAEFIRREPGKMSLHKTFSRLTEADEELIAAMKGAAGVPVPEDRTREAWQHLVHLGMLVLWNKGFRQPEGQNNEKITLSYGNLSAGIKSSDDQALCFLLVTIAFFKKMKPGKNLVCRQQNGIWLFDEEPLQMTGELWTPFWDNARRLWAGEIKTTRKYVIHEIRAGEEQVTLSVSSSHEREK